MIQEYFKDCMNEEQLRARHRELVVRMHPDRNPDNPNATAEFQEMQSQYEERLASAKGRERRQRYEQEQREREERERKEREQRRFEEVITQARRNKGVSFRKLYEGDYVYARKANATNDYAVWEALSCEALLHVVLKMGVADETVVKVEKIIELDDEEFMDVYLSYWIKDVYGGWETIQQANPMGGVPKARKVAKVVMLRSQHYCVFGNPMGDMQSITDYYVPCDYGEMFSDKIHILQAEMERERIEQERKEQERKARLLAEQQPLLDEWGDKLIAISAALDAREKEKVAVENLKTMLKQKFYGTRFKVGSGLGYYHITWEDGPTTEEVYTVRNLFDHGVEHDGDELTPWQVRFGYLDLYQMRRTMSTIAKATILQQLGQITDAFATSGYEDEVAVNDFDWKMLHLMVGINVDETTEPLCRTNGRQLDGKHIVEVRDAVQYVFDHTSYVKARKKKATKVAA